LARNFKGTRYSKSGERGNQIKPIRD
jgi:hypothetical protein